jgi:hypothetical protein
MNPSPAQTKKCSSAISLEYKPTNFISQRCPAATMAGALPDDSTSGNTPLLLPNPASNIYATTRNDVLDKVMETIKRKQKILAKNICIPGTKTYVAAWIQQTYAIVLEADPKATM